MSRSATKRFRFINPFRPKQILLFISLVLFFCQPFSCLWKGSQVLGQTNWKYNQQFNFGVHVNLTYSNAQKFPGLKIFGAYSILGYNKNHIAVNYSPSISIYSKTIGTNLNPLVGDLELDFINSFSIGSSWGKEETYFKNLRTIHPTDFYNISTKNRNLVLLTSNFIFNNNKRNQIVGAISGTFTNFSFYYANDGGFPMTKLPLGDNFDRYWTGSGGIFFHNKKGYNIFEFSFDQFTGYTPLLYELSNIIGINVPLYSEESNTLTHKTKPTTLNSSAYQLKINLDPNYAIDLGVIGNLINKNGYHFGIQDLIHMSLKIPLHPNNDLNRFFIGGSYLNQKHEK